MKLYTLLRDRASINILKILYDNEVVGGKYSMKYSELKGKLGFSGRSTLENLELVEMIAQETNGGGKTVLSITAKGKEFVDHFDKLIAVFEGRKEEQKAFTVEYDLTQSEQRLLVLCSKVKSETGGVVELQALTHEVYPYKDPAKVSGVVAKNAKKLEELNLFVRHEKKNGVFFDITESGERVVKEQLLEAAVPEV
ncbi:hypothetical protein ACFL3V_06040 [Nanoarchaeota archaeon]